MITTKEKIQAPTFEAVKFPVDDLEYKQALLHEIELCTKAINVPDLDRDTRIEFLHARSLAKALLYQLHV